MANHQEMYKVNKVTKGAIRYGTGDSDSPYGDIYIRKSLFTEKKPPETIKVTFEWQEGK
jgi:hypothetical protein